MVPQAPCAVEGTLTGAKAFYFPPAEDGSRGGTFFVNVDDPSSWGTFELEAMAFHEGIPGHHLQLAIAGELPDSVPTFRKHVHNSAYAEGWGLYTERLSDEMGLYATPVDRMGMLAADSMRAMPAGRRHRPARASAGAVSRRSTTCSRTRPLSEGVVRPEIDRYVVSPGQATSYMIGRLEIQRMRREAEQRQGDGFDGAEVPLRRARLRLAAARGARPGGEGAAGLSAAYLPASSRSAPSRRRLVPGPNRRSRQTPRRPTSCSRPG